MKVIAEFTIIPIGVGTSLSRYVAACENILEEIGLEHELHANGTNVEGEWDEVMAAIKQCHLKLHEMGVPRISTTVRVGTRIDREQTMTDKIQSVRKKMQRKGER